MKKTALLSLVLLLILAPYSVGAQSPLKTQLILTGGSSSPALVAGMINAMLPTARDGRMHIVVLPVASSTNPEQITETNRSESLKTAEARRKQFEDACRQQSGPNLSCKVTLAPVLVRADAQDPANVALFSDSVTGAIILGGDAGNGMQVLSGSPVEAAMEQLYRRGGAIVGMGAGANMLAGHMLAGYRPNFDMKSALSFGAVDMWDRLERQGSSFGPQDVVIDSQFNERGRLPRLLNAISLPAAPGVGLGIDTGMGVSLQDSANLGQVFGPSTITILDTETYHAAAAVQYQPGSNNLKLRNVLIHTLAPGSFNYNLPGRRHSLVGPPAQIDRHYDNTTAPARAGPLVLSANLLAAPQHEDILNRFVNWSGGAKGNILIIAAGFSRPDIAQLMASRFQDTMRIPARIVILEEASDEIAGLDGVTGVVVIGLDQSLIRPASLAALTTAWRAGLPLLMDGGAAAMAGKFYNNPTPGLPEASDPASDALPAGGFKTQTGLGLVNFNLSPRVQDDNRWNDMISLAYNIPAQPAIGLTDASWLEITSAGSLVKGDSPVYVLDFSYATLSRGINGGMVIANGLLDVFGAGEILAPEAASVNIAPFRVPTPNAIISPPPGLDLPWMEASPAALQATPEPTRRSATPTPLRFTSDITDPITPSSEVSAAITSPTVLNLMVIVGGLPVLVVLIGLLVRRKKPMSNQS